MKTANFPVVEFKEIVRLNPYWSSWTCFCEVIWKRKNLSKKTIRRYFDELVERDDYDRKDRLQLLNNLYALAEGVPL